MRINPNLRELLNREIEQSETVFDIDQWAYQVLGDWYHFAIFNMIQTDFFEYNIHQIAKRLGIKTYQVSLAIDRLLEIGMIREENNRLFCNFDHGDSLDKNKTKEAHKTRQKQIVQKSLESIEKDSIDIRDHQTVTMAIDPAKIPKARKMITDFIFGQLVDRVCQNQRAWRRWVLSKWAR